MKTDLKHHDKDSRSPMKLNKYKENHTVFKDKDKGKKCLKQPEEGNQITFIEKKKKKVDCQLPPIKKLEAKTQWKHIIKLLNGSNCRHKVLFPTKIPFKHKCEINTLSNKNRILRIPTEKTQHNYFETLSCGCEYQ